MARMGHVRVDAATVDQHRTDSRDRVIAEYLGDVIQPATRGFALGADDENRTRILSLGS